MLLACSLPAIRFWLARKEYLLALAVNGSPMLAADDDVRSDNDETSHSAPRDCGNFCFPTFAAAGTLSRALLFRRFQTAT